MGQPEREAEAAGGPSELSCVLERVHECPKCGWLISDADFVSARFDYLCPRCEEKHLSEFSIRTLPRSYIENPGQLTDAAFRAVRAELRLQ